MPPGAPAACRQRVQAAADDLLVLGDCTVLGEAPEKALLPSMRLVAIPAAYCGDDTLGGVARALLTPIGACVEDHGAMLRKLVELGVADATPGEGGNGTSPLPPAWVLFKHPYYHPDAGRAGTKCMHGKARPTLGITKHTDGYLRMRLGKDEGGRCVWEYCHRIVAWAAYGTNQGRDVCCHLSTRPSRCCAPTCLHPHHLEWATHADNMRHMATVGKAGKRGYTQPCRTKRQANRDARAEKAQRRAS
jgi:hypothetical protein